MAWAELVAIAEDYRQSIRDDAGSRPVACPNDGTPLVAAPGGVLHCPWDGWQWPRDEYLRRGNDV